MATEAGNQPNDLYRVASGGGLVLSLLLLAGSSGHLMAVLPSLLGVRGPVDPNWLTLLLPAIALTAAGLGNALLIVPLWRRRAYAARLSLAINLSAAAYFGYLLVTGLPDHPIGLFLTLASCHLMLLTAVGIGLRWPAQTRNGPNGRLSSPEA